MINFDLHIHSIASRYKESEGIVDNSTLDNAEVLLGKLNESEVGLFSITDHNRFFPELYERFDELIHSKKYPSVQGLVAGVEFDVKLDPKMSKCHIITLFDAKNECVNYRKIYDVIETHILNQPQDSYSRDEYESILREIGLDVILIACQRNSIDNHDGLHNSLSDSTMEPEELIASGYINALEFQKPNVEGILRDNLRKIPENAGLVTGSDCHEWEAYPYHDRNQKNLSFRFSRANILPSFKGLLMAVTSPETRVNQQENRNKEYIKSIQINDERIILTNGLIAIIGENGSGKSSLLEMISNKGLSKHVKELQEKNKISCHRIGEPRCKYVKQGQIVKKFTEKNLFPTENYARVDHSSFTKAYRGFAENLLDFIRRNIKANEAIRELNTERIEYNEELTSAKSYFINVEMKAGFVNIDNPHNPYDKELRDVAEKVLAWYSDEYFIAHKEEIRRIIVAINSIWGSIHKKNIEKRDELEIRNHIVSDVKEYERKVGEAATSQQRDQKEYLARKTKFVDAIIEAVKQNSTEKQFPTFPDIINGNSKKLLYGFSFNSEAVYNGKDVSAAFLSRMFTAGYQTKESLEQIVTEEELKRAVNRCGTIEQIDEQYKHNLEAFLEEMCVEEKYIVDCSLQSEALGNTLGEMSLAYFRYSVENEDKCSVFLIVQPEDHISNNNVCRKLRTYIDSIRHKKQVIIATHNPLLVVNQDVDQVIFVQNVNQNLKVISGCLEYEDETVNILDIVAKNMDGGRESIEKRLRVYGKENFTENVI